MYLRNIIKILNPNTPFKERNKNVTHCQICWTRLNLKESNPKKGSKWSGKGWSKPKGGPICKLAIKQIGYILQGDQPLCNTCFSNICLKNIRLEKGKFGENHVCV